MTTQNKAAMANQNRHANAYIYFFNNNPYMNYYRYLCSIIIELLWKSCICSLIVLS